MNKAIVIKHTMSIEYTCPVDMNKHSIKINNPSLEKSRVGSDWDYTALEFKCPHCDGYHTLEVNI